MIERLFDGLIELAKRKQPVQRCQLEYWTERYMQFEEELTFDEADTIDALLRLIEERVVDDDACKEEADETQGRGGTAPREV